MIRSLGTATPPLYVTQEQALVAIRRLFSLAGDEERLYEKLLSDGPIRGRYLGMDRVEDAAETDPDRLNERFRKYAVETGARAAQEALARAGLTPGDMGALVVNTCTGYLCPGLSSYLLQSLDMDKATSVLDVMGMGCGSAIPALKAAAGFLYQDAGKPALCVSVEICSATIYMDPDPGLVVSNAIFGDGAAAAVLDVETGNGRRGIRLLDFESETRPENREDLRYRMEAHRLRNVLSPRVPALGARATTQVVERLLQRNRMAQGDVRWWAVHPGGTRVMEAIGGKLGLHDDELKYSHEVLHAYGNMSSPSVLFVLDAICRKGCPRGGERGLVLSFGAGFSAHGALIEWSGSGHDAAAQP